MLNMEFLVNLYESDLLIFGLRIFNSDFDGTISV